MITQILLHQYDLYLTVLLKVQINRKENARIRKFYHTFHRAFTIKRRRSQQKVFSLM